MEAMVAQSVVDFAQEMHSGGLLGVEEEDAADLKNADPVSQGVKPVPYQEAEAGQEEVSE